MRLLNTLTFTLRVFNSNVPDYAILSHRWLADDEEVTFHDIESDREHWAHKEGVQKVERFCQVARDNGYKWVWLDTCCIDKSNSVELHEVINSMYRFYGNSHICYVYLADVERRRDFKKSSWFTRGWTLQELLAPVHIEFYNKDWVKLGTERELSRTISDITGIDRGALVGRLDPTKYPVAMRMSWAAGRRTTRVEDVAYSLLGIFGVNMPLIYGEGERAFQRLQDEILKVTEDYTLLAWERPPFKYNFDSSEGGVLAKSPDDFGHYSGDTTDYCKILPINVFQKSTMDPGGGGPLPNFKLKPRPKEGDLEPPRMTPRGLRLTLPFVMNYVGSSHFEMGPLAFLSCVVNEKGTPLVCIALFRDEAVQPVMRFSDIATNFLRPWKAKTDYPYYRMSNSLEYIEAKSVVLEFKTVYLRTAPSLTQQISDSRGEVESSVVIVYLNSTDKEEPLLYRSQEVSLKIVTLLLSFNSSKFSVRFSFNSTSAPQVKAPKLIREMTRQRTHDSYCKDVRLHTLLRHRPTTWVEMQGTVNPKIAEYISTATQLYTLEIWVEPRTEETIHLIST